MEQGLPPACPRTCHVVILLSREQAAVRAPSDVLAIAYDVKASQMA